MEVRTYVCRFPELQFGVLSTEELIHVEKLTILVEQSLVPGVDLTDQIHLVESILQSENAACAAILSLGVIHFLS